MVGEVWYGGEGLVWWQRFGMVQNVWYGLPSRMAGATAITFTTIRSREMNLGLKRPKSPLYLKPWKAEFRISVVKVAVMQQKNTWNRERFIL